jgi:hypothetical protein
MDLRRILKEQLVEQLTYNDGRISLLFHRESLVSVGRLVQLVGKNGKYRITPEGRLSFAPKSEVWDEVVREVIDFLATIQEPAARKPAVAVPSPGGGA